MTQRLTLTNQEIYIIAQSLLEATKQKINYPVKINFYFEKNKTLLLQLAEDLDKARMQILEKYKDDSADVEENKIQIKPEYIDQVNQELEDLFSLQQELTVYTIDLDAFENINMTPQEFQAINFMITENYVEEEEKE